MTTDRAADDVFDAGAAERARLLAQCELYRMETELLFDCIGVESGWRALDLGCGPLGVLDILVDRVGAGGSVVGLDREPRMLAMAAQRGLVGVALVQGEITATGLPGASFDLVHERRVLVDVPRPEEVVSELARLVRPGGYVALQDTDVVSWACEPPCRAWDLLVEALIAAWAGDPHVGRRLPALLRGAGLVDVEADVHAGLWRPGELNHTLLPHLVGRHRGRILVNGTLTERELDAHLRDVEGHLAHPDTIVLGWTLFQAWGRRPFTP